MGLGNLFDSVFGGKKESKPELPAPPPAPDPTKIAEDEKKKVQKRLANRTQTNFTSPLGAAEQANTDKKQLLG